MAVDPQALERQYLDDVEQTTKSTFQPVFRKVSMLRTMGSVVMVGSYAGELDEIENWYNTYGPAACQLAYWGFPRLAYRLGQLISELRDLRGSLGMTSTNVQAPAVQSSAAAPAQPAAEQKPPGPDLDELQRNALNVLNNEPETFAAFVARTAPRGRPMTPGEVDAERQFMKRQIARYQTVSATAKQLSAAGRTQVAERLDFLLKDVQGALAITDKMYDDAVAAQGAQAKIARDSQLDTFNVFQDMHKAQQAAYDAANARWTENH